MRIRRIIIPIVTLLLCLQALAAPVKRILMVLTQPSGEKFEAVFAGDEFIKIIKTKDTGCSIIKDEGGWWCYAAYLSDGTKVSSGVHVGAPASSAVISQSRNIPYTLLAQKAIERRSALTQDRLPILKRLAARTKADPSESVQKHGIAILVQYKDVEMTYTKADFENLLSNKSGCAIEYFNDQFNGAAEFHFDVSEVVTLSKNRSYYGGNNSSDNDSRPGEMVYEACALADESVDFSKYDDDGDGYVDNVVLFFAGQDEAEDPDENADCIWSHAWTLKAAKASGDGQGEYQSSDGVKVDNYAATSELTRIYTTQTRYTTQIAGIGTFCHEFSHTLGLPDLYDTDYDKNGQSAALWHWTALMDGGNHNNNGSTPAGYNCLDLLLTGLRLPEEIHAGEYELKPINQGGSYLKIPTASEDEFFLIECRGTEKWDEYIGYYSARASGLLVYHVDMSDKTIWNNTNTVNAIAAHQCVDLIEADGRPDNVTEMGDATFQNYLYDISGVFFPKGAAMLSSESHSAFRTWGGGEVPFTISGITKNSDGSVSFKVISTGDDGAPLPEVANVEYEALPDAIILNWESSPALTRNATLTYTGANGVSQSLNVGSYEEGKYSRTITGLRPDEDYTIEIFYQNSTQKGEVETLTVRTLPAASTKYPYIYAAGSFIAGEKLALRVVNSGSEKTTWSFDGKTASVGKDGYFYPAAGTYVVKAVFDVDEDDSRETIRKTIKIEDAPKEEETK